MIRLLDILNEIRTQKGGITAKLLEDIWLDKIMNLNYNDIDEYREVRNLIQNLALKEVDPYKLPRNYSDQILLLKSPRSRNILYTKFQEMLENNNIQEIQVRPKKIEANDVWDLWLSDPDLKWPNTKLWKDYQKYLKDNKMNYQDRYGIWQHLNNPKIQSKLPIYYKELKDLTK